MEAIDNSARVRLLMINEEEEREKKIEMKREALLNYVPPIFLKLAKESKEWSE